MGSSIEKYNLATRIVHWVSALLIFVLLASGMIAEDMANGPDKLDLILTHKSMGALALIFLLVRFVVRATNPVAPLPGMARADVIKAKAIQGLIYLALLIMPISGMLLSQTAGYGVEMFGIPMPTLMDKNEELHEVFEVVHGLTSKVLIVLLIAHIGAALLHHFKMKDDVLKRMI